MKVGIFEYNWGKVVGGSHMYLGAAAEALSRLHDVTILHQFDDLSNGYMADFLDLDLSRVEFRPVPRLDRARPAPAARGPWGRHRSRVGEHAELSREFDLFIYNPSFNVPFFNRSPRGVLVVDFPFRSYDWWHDFGQAPPRLASPAGAARRLYRRYLWRERFASYHRILTYSEFCRAWLRRRWFADAEVVHPPCRDGIAPAAKEQVVLGVGRFVPDKKADALVEAFRALCDRGLRGWRLILAGGAPGDGDEGATYLESLRRRAHGYPIELRIDVPGPDLRRLFEAAAIFWHAKGYGVDPRAHPEHMEHFGIVTVEAMMAGCVPVVFAGGGHPEIVNHGVDGFLWGDLGELADRTWDLALSPPRLAEMAGGATRRAEAFGKHAFAARFLEAVLGRHPSSTSRGGPTDGPGCVGLHPEIPREGR